MLGSATICLSSNAPPRKTCPSAVSANLAFDDTETVGGLYSGDSMSTLEERFWAKVDKSGDCWEWTANKTPGGYGKIGVGPGKLDMAHRFSMRLHRGAIPDGQCVLHRCDNPGCVNPGHLFLGTQADNIRDMMSKGRGCTGERQGRSKLTADQVVEIRMWCAAGFPQSKIAAAYEIGQAQVSRIFLRLRWRHIP